MGLEIPDRAPRLALARLFDDEPTLVRHHVKRLPTHGARRVWGLARPLPAVEAACVKGVVARKRPGCLGWAHGIQTNRTRWTRVNPTPFLSVANFDPTRRAVICLCTTPPVHTVRVYKLSPPTPRPSHFELERPDGLAVLLAHVFFDGLLEHDDGVIILFHTALGTLYTRLEPFHDTTGMERVLAFEFLRLGTLRDVLKTHGTCV